MGGPPVIAPGLGLRPDQHLQRPHAGHREAGRREGGDEQVEVGGDRPQVVA
jgi:hypothetical protein